MRPIRQPYFRPHHYSLTGLLNHFAAVHASAVRRGLEKMEDVERHARSRFAGHPDIQDTALRLVQQRLGVSA